MALAWEGVEWQGLEDVAVQHANFLDLWIVGNPQAVPLPISV